MFEEKLTEAINEILIAEQDKRGIKSGDCDLWLTLELDKTIIRLSELMEKILEAQK